MVKSAAIYGQITSFTLIFLNLRFALEALATERLFPSFHEIGWTQSHYIEVVQGGISSVEQYTIDYEYSAYLNFITKS